TAVRAIKPHSMSCPGRLNVTRRAERGKQSPGESRNQIKTRTLSQMAAAVLGVGAVGLIVAALSLRPPVSTESTHPPSPRPTHSLSGEPARLYLEQSGEGESLAQALTAARFGLEWRA